MHKFTTILGSAEAALGLLLALTIGVTLTAAFYPTTALAQRFELIPDQTQDTQDNQQTQLDENNQQTQQEQQTQEIQELQPASSADSTPPPSPFSTSALSLEISPPVAYIHIKPQDILRHRVMLKNTGTQTLFVNVSMADFKADGRTGQPVLQIGQLFNRQVSPEQNYGETIRLEPDQNKSYNLELDISQLTPEKEYPIAILFNAKTVNNSTSADGSITQVAGTLASNLILFISDSEENQGDIAIQQLNAPRLIDSFGSIKFEIVAENLGKNATPIVGQAVVYNIFNQKIAEYIFYPDYVLAKNTRLVRGTELSPEILNAEGKLDPERINDLFTNFNYKPPFMFGAYTIQVQLADQQRTVRVIALPFSIIIAAGIGLAVYFGYKKLVKKVG